MLWNVYGTTPGFKQLFLEATVFLSTKAYFSEYTLQWNLHRLMFCISFYRSIDLFSTPGWVPHNGDFLYARFRTTELTETFFELNSTKVQMIDLGGQQLDRKKWIQCFEDVDCVIFGVALSSYNQHTVEGYNAVGLPFCLCSFYEQRIWS